MQCEKASVNIFMYPISVCTHHLPDLFTSPQLWLKITFELLSVFLKIPWVYLFLRSISQISVSHSVPFLLQPLSTLSAVYAEFFNMLVPFLSVLASEATWKLFSEFCLDMNLGHIPLQGEMPMLISLPTPMLSFLQKNLWVCGTRSLCRTL